MADTTKEFTVEDKLRAIYDLQLIHSRLDSIQNVRGELPLEVEDLADEIAGMETRLSRMEDEVKDQENDIKEKKNNIKDHQSQIKKYEEQQKNVRNNREFDAISKEIEFQELEIQLAEKRIREQKARIEAKIMQIEELKSKLEERTLHLHHKREELDGILQETEKEENALLALAEEYKAKIDARLLAAYTRIRNSARNGLSVVPIERGASGGSFFTIPPQRQLEIATRRKIISDEHSGRILVDAALAREEEERMNEIFRSLQH